MAADFSESTTEYLKHIYESRVVTAESSGDTLFGFDPCKRKQSIIDNGLLNLLHSSAVRI